MSNTLQCRECDNPARWHVWYKNFSSPTARPFFPFNMAYNTLCDDHAMAEMKNGRAGYAVETVKLVNDQFLPEGDRALFPPVEDEA